MIVRKLYKRLCGVIPGGTTTRWPENLQSPVHPCSRRHTKLRLLLDAYSIVLRFLRRDTFDCSSLFVDLFVTIRPRKINRNFWIDIRWF